MSHLYEVIISNSRVWLKVQASCLSSAQAAAFFEARFNGTNYIVDGHRPVTSFKLSQRSDFIFNWASIVDRLPSGWNDDEFRIVEPPYPWCEILSDDCDCHGSKGRLDAAYCSDFGLHEETDKRARKTENVRHHNHVQTMMATIARRDESRRRERLQRAQLAPPPKADTPKLKTAAQNEYRTGKSDILAHGIGRINRLIAKGFYCSIEGCHHPYGQQALLKTVASLNAICAQLSTSRGVDHESEMSLIDGLAKHLLMVYQSEECAQESVTGEADLPDILYKYIPKERIGKGAPNSLRATQLLALNDDMECNVTTMKGSNQEDTLAWLAEVKSKLERYLGIVVPWEELLTRSLRYGDLRLSTFVQEYLNPLVGVVSFSKDATVPTMWAHYAQNTGIVVGYDTKALSALGFELRPVMYSEIAPTYYPEKDDAIWLDFVDREHMERELRAGRKAKGSRLLARTKLAEFGMDWKSLSRLLLVKGMSWSYEKEVRLLVDLESARDTGDKDGNDWPVKVIDPPPEAIKEIYQGANTQRVDVQRAIEEARGENKRGLLVMQLSSHAFSIQKTIGSQH